MSSLSDVQKKILRIALRSALESILIGESENIVLRVAIEDAEGDKDVENIIRSRWDYIYSKLKEYSKNVEEVINTILSGKQNKIMKGVSEAVKMYVYGGYEEAEEELVSKIMDIVVMVGMDIEKAIDNIVNDMLNKLVVDNE